MIFRIPARLTPYILQPRVWSVCLWLAALIATVAQGYVAWHSYDTHNIADPAQRRADGNFGHTLIDFGGQWVSARIIATGHGRDLYLRSVQREIAESGYPRSDQTPESRDSDAATLVSLMVEVPESKPLIGGPLYPPTHAVLFAPLGLLTPRASYRATQIGILTLTWLCGWFLSRISGGRFPWPVTTLFVMGYPGFLGALHLGQNSVHSLAILTGGWLLLVRDRPFAAGVVWGLLAYKPTWAAAFVLVPLLTGRWRMLLGMMSFGILFGLATFPIVGIDAWFQWLEVGKWASYSYGLDENWIFLSRDVLGIPRRWLLDFKVPLDERDRLAATLIGWGLWTIILLTTAILTWRKRPIGTVGPAAAFVGLGAWLSCYHFIYYDSLLSLLPVFLLLAERRYSVAMLGIDDDDRVIIFLNVFVMIVVAFLIVTELGFPALAIDINVTLGFVQPGAPLPREWLFSTKQHGTPWDTFALILLWVYCGLRNQRATGASTIETDTTTDPID